MAPAGTPVGLFLRCHSFISAIFIGVQMQSSLLVANKIREVFMATVFLNIINPIGRIGAVFPYDHPHIALFYLFFILHIDKSFIDKGVFAI